MTEAAALVAGGTVAPWTTIVADHQTRGRGRQGRAWESAPGDAMLATVIAQFDIPVERSGLIAIAAGVAVARVLERFGVLVKLKWPNDIFANGLKLGGILIQAQPTEPIPALVGIGINVRSHPPGNATDLVELNLAPPLPAELAVSIAAELRSTAAELESGRYESVIAEWTRRAIWLGEQVDMVADTAISGTFIGIDEHGRALMQTSSGCVAFVAGDIRRGPRRVA